MRNIILFTLLLINLAAYSQIGGNHVYQFLDLPQASRAAGLGGNMISLWDNDIQLSEQNPALLHPGISNQFNFNYIGYISDISLMSVMYAHSLGDSAKYGTASFSIYTANYGDFDETDAFGNTLGEFKASETAYQIGWAYPLTSQFNLGIRGKLINSLLANYFSIGLAGDAGLMYHPNPSFSVSLVAKNMGVQLSNYYTGAEKKPLPFEVELAMSKRLAHAPFRIHLSWQHLEQFDLLYEDPQNPSSYTNPLTGETESKSQLELISSNIFRHLVVGAEFIPTENFYVDVAFNAQRRYELMVEEKMGTVGFSWGFGLKVSKFKVSFSRAIYHLSGGSNHFSVTTNLSDFYKKSSRPVGA